MFRDSRRRRDRHQQGSCRPQGHQAPRL